MAKLYSQITIKQNDVGELIPDVVKFVGLNQNNTGVNFLRVVFDGVFPSPSETVHVAFSSDTSGSYEIAYTQMSYVSPGVYEIQFPDEVIAQRGTWYLSVALFDLWNTKTGKAQAIRSCGYVSFSVSASVKNKNGTVITDADVAALFLQARTAIEDVNRMKDEIQKSVEDASNVMDSANNALNVGNQLVEKSAELLNTAETTKREAEQIKTDTENFKNQSDVNAKSSSDSAIRSESAKNIASLQSENAKQSANQAQAALQKVETLIQSGIYKTLSFQTVNDFLDWYLNDEMIEINGIQYTKSDLTVGDDIMIIEKGVPDLWYTGINETDDSAYWYGMPFAPLETDTSVVLGYTEKAKQSADIAEESANRAEESANRAESEKTEALQLIDQARKDAELVESFSDALFSTFLDDTNTSEIFRRWYALNNDGVATKYDLLSRFFTMCAVGNEQQHTLRFYAAEASSATAGTPLDWLADKQAAPLATDTNDPGAGWDEENRLTWWIMGNALKKEDGTLDVLYIEGEDGFDITGELAPVYTFQMCPYFREEVTEEYEIRSWRATPAPGYRAWETGIDGKKRAMVWHPAFDGGFTTEGGKLTSGAGRHAAIFNSASQGLTAARKWNDYEGTWGDSDTKWLLYEWQHRHFNKENGGILEGCTNYNVQYKAALGEENTTRVLLSTANGANIIPGSCVLVGEMGTNTSPDRAQAYMRNLSGGAVKVLARNTVTVNGAQYSEIVLDLAAPITTTTTTCISTIAWDTGSTLGLPHHRDGSIGSLTNGRYPLRVAGIEAMIGCYAIGLDPLYRTTANAGGGYDYAIFECKNAKNQASSITENYVDTGLTYSGLPSGWQYVKKFKTTEKAILFPDKIGGSSTGYYKSAFNGAYKDSVLCPWPFAGLYVGGSAGLAAEDGNNTPSNSSWRGAPRLTGSGAMRG